MISTTLRLPVGEVFHPTASRSGRRLVLQHPLHGDYVGPFLVIRLVTLDEYCDAEADDGSPLTIRERGRLACLVKIGRYRLYEIALD